MLYTSSADMLRAYKHTTLLLLWILLVSTVELFTTWVPHMRMSSITLMQSNALSKLCKEVYPEKIRTYAELKLIAVGYSVRSK